MNLCGANSAAGLSSRPVQIVVMDECDACIRAAGTTSDPTRLLMARATTFIDRKEVFLSSPANEPEENGILQMWSDSSRGRLQTRCPNSGCQHWQVLEWDRMDLDSAMLACSKCGNPFSQWEWNGQGEEGIRWFHENPTHPTAGFRLAGLNSPWLDWKTDLIDEFKEADRISKLGDDSLLRVFYNTKLAEAFKVLGKGVDLQLYNTRREVYECHQHDAEIPDGVLLLTASVNVMDDFLAYETIGWCRGRESYGIECGEIEGDPHILPDPRNPGKSPWDRIDSLVFNRLFRCSDEALMKVRLLGVDSGGHCTSEVYHYTRRRQPRALSLKGVGGAGRPIIISGRGRERHEGALLIRIGVDALKEEFHRRLQIMVPGPGYCHFPRAPDGADVAGYTEGFFAQLLAEHRVIRYSRGGFARFEWWKPRSDPNEALDLRCYSRACLEYLKVHLEQIQRDAVHVNSEQIEEINIDGRKILAARGGLRREYQMRPVKPPQTTSMNIGAEEVRIQWTGSTGPPKKQRYGAAGGQSF